ncbi:MAG TPA: ABC transporter substrate-binding protein [Dehalococcoidia bacterium]|nr:ABC transporter substrate-binding protein [Dehalococcoidia bacterium]
MLAVACSSSGDTLGSGASIATVVTVLSPLNISETPAATPVGDVGSPPAATAFPSISVTPVLPPTDIGGGFLRFSVPESGPHFDIHREVSPALSTWGIGLIYSRLLRNADADSTSLVECEICQSWEFVDSEKLRITLRSDVMWQNIAPLNGRRLVASDVAFSLERQRGPGNPNGDLLTGIGGITAVDDRTLDLELVPSGLDADLLLNLADGRTRMVAPEMVAIHGDLLRGPNVGSGPWIWVDTTSQTAAYDRNPDYFESGTPGIDGLQISYIPQASTRNAAFRVGLLDFVDASGEETARTLKNFPGITSKLISNFGTGAEIAFNTDKSPFTSQLFRQAVFRALDPWSDLEEVWGGEGVVTLGIPAPRSAWLLSEAAMRTGFADVDRAAELSSESGVVPTGSIEITVGQFGDLYLLQARKVADALAILGFESTIREVTTRKFADDVWIGGDYQVFVGAQAPVDGVSDDLFSVHHSKGMWNTTGFSSDELDGLIELQTTQLDPSGRRRTLLDAQFRILEGAHRFTVAARTTHWIAQEWVGGFDPDPRRGESAWLARLTLGEHEET